MAKKKKRKKRKGNTGKGSAFERRMCKELSLWWTDGERDDVFWRTSGSGARATNRGKRKKQTFGQHGDIQATDPIAQPLLNRVTIELKKGYNKHTIMDCLDALDRNKAQVMEVFVEQAMRESTQAGVHSWWIILARDKRIPMIMMPMSYFQIIRKAASNFKIKQTYLIARLRTGQKVMMMRLYEFLEKVSPYDVESWQ